MCFTAVCVWCVCVRLLKAFQAESTHVVVSVSSGGGERGATGCYVMVLKGLILVMLGVRCVYRHLLLVQGTAASQNQSRKTQRIFDKS